MALSPKQKAIIKFGMENETFQNKDLLGHSIVDTFYASSSANIGKILSKMVKQGYLIRLKPGHFKVNLSYRKKVKNIETQNEKLF